MFDMFTTNDLYFFHTALCKQGERLHDRFMALPSSLSPEADVLMAKCAEISETMTAVYNEIDRRIQEGARITAEIHALNEVMEAGTDA